MVRHVFRYVDVVRDVMFARNKRLTASSCLNMILAAAGQSQYPWRLDSQELEGSVIATDNPLSNP
jgi:hypothetical protein